MAGFTGALGSLWVEIGAKIAKFESGMADVSKSIDKTIKDSEQKFAGFAKVGDKMSSFGTGLTAAVTLPILGIGVAAVKASGDFDTAMRLVSARGDITGESLGKLKAQAEDLGAKTQFSSRQAAEGMAELAGAGFKTNEIYAAMPGVMNLAAAAGSSVGDAAKVTKDILGQFGLEAANTAEVVDMMTKAGNESSGTLGEMANSLKYVGPVARAAGYDLAETSGALVLLDKAGIRGEQAGTSLRSMLLSLQGPTKIAAELMAKYKIAVQDTSGKLLPMPKILDNFKAAMANVGGPAEQAAVLTKIFGENAVTAAQGLIAKGGPALVEFTKIIRDSGGEARRTAEVMNSGMGGALERMSGSIETAAQKIGDVLAPTVVKLAGYLESTANLIADVAGWFAKLPDIIQLSAIGFLALAAAIGPVLIIAGQLAGSISSISAALTLLTPAMAAGTGLVGRLQEVIKMAAGSVSGLLVPALIVLAVAMNALAIKSLIDEFGTLGEAMRAASTDAVGSSTATKDLNDSLVEAAAKSNGFGNALSTINFEKVDKACVDSANAVRDWQGALEAAEKKWQSLNWADLLTPWGMLKKLVMEAAEMIQFFTGRYPEMDKSAKTALSNIANHTSALMKVQGQNAQAIEALRGANEKLVVSQAAAAKAAKEAAKAHKLAEKAAGEQAQREADAWDAAYRRYEAQGKATLQEVKWIEDKYAEYKRINQGLDKANQDLANAYGASWLRMHEEVQKVVVITVPLIERIPKALYDAMKATDELRDSFKRMGIQSSEALKQQADHAVADYERIKAAGERGQASVRDVEAAWIRMEEIRQAAAKQAGDYISKQDEELLRKRKAAYEAGTKIVLTEWQKLSEGIKRIAESLKKDIAGALSKGIWSFGERGEFNKQLEEQETALKDSLAKQTEEWGKYQQDAAAELAKLGDDYATELADMDKDYADSLAERMAEYADFADQTATNIADIAQKHKEGLEQEKKDLTDNLRDKEQEYQDYEKDVVNNIEEIRAKYQHNLEEETRNLQDALRDRTQEYRDFVDDANHAMSRLGEDTATNIDRETKDTQDNIDEKTKDYDRYTEDVADQIAELRKKNKGQYSKEEGDLQKSLRRKKEDLDTYVGEQNRKLQEYIADQQKRQAREEQDNRDSLDRKQRDYAEFLAKNKGDQDQAYADYQAGLTKEIGAQEENLAKRKQALEDFRTETAQKIDIATAKHEEAMTKEITQQQTALDKKTEALDKFNTAAATKYEEDRAAAKTKYDESTTDLQTSLENKRKEYDDFIAEISGPGGKLDALKEAHRTVWGDIGKYMTDAFKDAGQAVTTFVTDFLEGLLFKKLGQLVSDILPGVGSAMGKALGSASSNVPSTPSTVPSTPSAPGGGGGGAAGAAMSGAMGWVSLGVDIAALGVDIFQSFQFAAMNKSLDLIENYTRYLKIGLVEQADSLLNDSHVIRNFASMDNQNYWGTTVPYYQDTMGKLEKLGEMHDRLGNMKDRLFEISSNTYAVQTNTMDGNTTLQSMLDELRKISGKDPVINVYVGGEKSADVNLKMQGIVGVGI